MNEIILILKLYVFRGSQLFFIDVQKLTYWDLKNYEEKQLRAKSQW